MEGVEVEGKDSFHPLRPMNKGFQRMSGGLEAGWNFSVYWCLGRTKKRNFVKNAPPNPWNFVKNQP
jgi:hypothetical protein